MPSLFSAVDAKVSAADSRIFGIKFRLRPWRVGGRLMGAGGPDPDRPVVEFVGVLTGYLKTQHIQGDTRGEGWKGGFVRTRTRQISVDLKDWPAGVRKDDRMEAFEEAETPTYQVLDFDDDGMSRMIVQCVLVGDVPE